MGRLAISAALLVALASAHSASAQMGPGQSPGARAGGAYVPSTHTPGCGGLLCDADDPQRAVGAAPPPPCEGLICGLSPYSMSPPVTAAEAQRIQEERARRAAAVAVEPVKPAKHVRRHVAKAKARKTVAARTPDPAGAPGAGAEK